MKKLQGVLGVLIGVLIGVLGAGSPRLARAAGRPLHGNIGSLTREYRENLHGNIGSQFRLREFNVVTIIYTSAFLFLIRMVYRIDDLSYEFPY